MNLKKILVGTDFSEYSGVAIRHGIEIMRSSNARFDLIHCWRAPEENRQSEYSGVVADAVANSVEKRGRELLEFFLPDAPNATFSSVHAAPKQGIEEALQSGDYDLVVMGSYGRSKFRRWLLGSVSEHTARIAQCPVAIARAET